MSSKKFTNLKGLGVGFFCRPMRGLALRKESPSWDRISDKPFSAKNKSLTKKERIVRKRNRESENI